MHVVFDYDPFAPLYENVTSSTKLEVQYITYSIAIRVGLSHVQKVW